MHRRGVEPPPTLVDLALNQARLPFRHRCEIVENYSGSNLHVNPLRTTVLRYD